MTQKQEDDELVKRFKDIHKKALKATPGPWTVEGEAVEWKPRQKPFTDQGAGIDAGIDQKNGSPINVIVGGAQDEQGGAVGVLSNADAAFIAAANPAAVIEMVETITRLNAALASALEALKEIASQHTSLELRDLSLVRYNDADFEGGYDACVEKARAAAELAKQQKETG